MPGLKPQDLPSTFYRFALKALIFDDDGRLLVAENEDHLYELPGGGWEYDDISFEAGMQRELREEIGIEADTIGPIAFLFRGQSTYGWKVARAAIHVKLTGTDLTPGDDIIATRYVTREEFLQLSFDPADAEILQYADQIWPAS